MTPARPEGSSVPRAGRAGRRRRLAATFLLLAVVTVATLLGTRWVVSRLTAPSCTFTVAGEQVELTPEQAANAATIALVSRDLDLPPRAATIALTTAIQESGLRNLTYGDADSLGLFQQRPSQGWGSEEEVLDAVYASTAFYRALEEVPGWEEGVVTEVAQEVQRSAFPDAYADHETEGRVLASVLTGQSPGALGCDLDAPGTPGSAQNVLDKAERTFSARGEVDGTTATIETGSAQDAWAVAAWAVAHAEVESVTTVTVDGRTWSREGGHDTGWTAATEPGAAPAAVVVRVAQDVG